MCVRERGGGGREGGREGGRDGGREGGREGGKEGGREGGREGGEREIRNVSLTCTHYVYLTQQPPLVL